MDTIYQHYGSIVLGILCIFYILHKFGNKYLEVQEVGLNFRLYNVELCQCVLWLDLEEYCISQEASKI